MAEFTVEIEDGVKIYGMIVKDALWLSQVRLRGRLLGGLRPWGVDWGFPVGGGLPGGRIGAPESVYSAQEGDGCCWSESSRHHHWCGTAAMCHKRPWGISATVTANAIPDVHRVS